MTKQEPENKGHQVFISYANEKGDNPGPDRQIADMIRSALESENIRCWIDHRDIMPGENWVNAMFNDEIISPALSIIDSRASRYRAGDRCDPG